MTRRGGAPRLPWTPGGTTSGGIYNTRRRSNARPIVLAAIVLGLVVLAWYTWGKLFGGEDCTEFYCPANEKYAIPPGYDLVSAVFAVNPEAQAPAGNDAVVTIKLARPTSDGRALGFFRWAPDLQVWEPVGPAVLDPQGQTVSGTFANPPPIIAVMRRLLPAGHVAAYLPHNATLHREATGRVTIVHTLDFAPSGDGTVTGELSSVANDGSFAFYPTISARASDKGAVAIVSSILASPQTRTNHVREIVRLVTTKQLAGIDIAYLDLAPDQRTSFALFISELGQQLHSQNKLLTLTLPPPIKVQERIDEGAYDWIELGKAADVLQIAPYRDQNTYRRDMPAILSHLASIVEPSKLVLTVTPYATEKATEGISTMSLAAAMSLATKLQPITGADQKITTSANVEIVATNIDRNENLSGVVWQPETATVAFTYKSGSARTVWIENFFSIGFKLEFIPRYQLGGVGIENASDDQYLGNIWTALVPFITTGQPVLLQPNPKDLEPRWAASKGSFEGGDRAGLRGSVKWVAPAEPGEYTITLTLSDGVYLFESEVSLTVQPRDTRTPGGSGTPSATPVG